MTYMDLQALRHYVRQAQKTVYLNKKIWEREALELHRDTQKGE